MPDVVHATRGCAHRCNFCSASAVWRKYYKRPIVDVIKDIKLLKSKYIVFNDVSLADDIEYAKELFQAMIPLKKKWGGLTTISASSDPELMDLMSQSGCKFLLIGFESFQKDVLSGIHKDFNNGHDYKTAMEVFHQHGISVQGCFVFGFDDDTPEIFQSTLDLVNDLKIDIPRYSIYTPYPGTELFQEMESELRIISYNWSDYDTMHVVFQPKLMSIDELYSGFKWSYHETFKLGSIFRRTVGSLDNSSVINFFGNLTYKIFVKRLYNEERFKNANGVVDNL